VTTIKLDKETTELCLDCGYGKSWHKQEPAYYGAEWLEPEATQSVAERDRGCKGWKPETVTLQESFRRFFAMREEKS
jgi:hypothetical protein